MHGIGGDGVTFAERISKSMELENTSWQNKQMLAM